MLKINLAGHRVWVSRWNDRGDDSKNEAVVEYPNGYRGTVLFSQLTPHQVWRIKRWPAWVTISHGA